MSQKLKAGKICLFCSNTVVVVVSVASSARVIVKNAIDDCGDYISVETSCVAVVNQTSSDFHCYDLM